jgi:hypothetical protein
MRDWYTKKNFPAKKKLLQRVMIDLVDTSKLLSLQPEWMKTAVEGPVSIDFDVFLLCGLV